MRTKLGEDNPKLKVVLHRLKQPSKHGSKHASTCDTTVHDPEVLSTLQCQVSRLRRACKRLSRHLQQNGTDGTRRAKISLLDRCVENLEQEVKALKEGGYGKCALHV